MEGNHGFVYMGAKHYHKRECKYRGLDSSRGSLARALMTGKDPCKRCFDENQPLRSASMLSSLGLSTRTMPKQTRKNDRKTWYPTTVGSADGTPVLSPPSESSVTERQCYTPRPAVNPQIIRRAAPWIVHACYSSRNDKFNFAGHHSSLRRMRVHKSVVFIPTFVTDDSPVTTRNYLLRTGQRGGLDLPVVLVCEEEQVMQGEEGDDRFRFLRANDYTESEPAS